MPIKGRLKEGELRIAQLRFDFMKQPMYVYALACITDPKVGSTIAWLPANGVVWSKETKGAIETLVQCMEKDIANISMVKSSASEASDGSTPRLGGIGEHLGDGTTDAPQM